MTTFERIIWIAVIAVLSVSLFLIRSENREMTEWVVKQNEQLIAIDALIDELTEVALSEDKGGSTETRETSEQIRERILNPPQIDLIQDWGVRHLQSKGLQNPIDDLKTNLISKPQLIRYEGIHGGTMKVFDKSSITILTGNWAYATFEDGHINGAMLLKYEIENGNISWDVIVQQLF